jgi:hypothetical protein
MRLKVLRFDNCNTKLILQVVIPMRRTKRLAGFLAILWMCSPHLTLLKFAIGAGMVFAFPANGYSQWTQWRGTKRDGSVVVGMKKEPWLPLAVMLWEREVGEGYSGPLKH